MPRVRAEVLELVFAGAVVVVFASAVAAVFDRVSRRTSVALAAFLGAAAAVAWVSFALKPSREVAVAAGGITVCAALELGVVVLRRLIAQARQVDRRLAEAEARFDALVSAEVDARAAELERTLSRARADSLSKLVAEERKIGETRRAALAEREHAAGAELSEALAKVEQRVAHRVAELNADLERTERGLTAQLVTLGQRQRQLMAEAESRLQLDTERLDTASEEQRERLTALETQFSGAIDELSRSSQEQLEGHERDRRRALHEVADRLRQRERELRERVAAEEAEAIERIQAGFADIERRQLDQLKRVVERTAASFSEAVSKQFGDAIRSARDDAQQRLSRELDRAVDHFAREAQGVLAERLAHVADAGGQRLERKLSQVASSLEHERDELVAELQRRIGDAEVELRSRVQALAADAEAERTVLNARLQELQRRIDEALSEAGSRLSPTFRD
jgi:hypothetical protein